MNEHTELERQKALAERIEAILDQKNAKDIERISVEGKTVLADFFIVATANNQTHIKSLADEVEFKLKEEFDLLPHHVEGEDGRRWILLDYGDVIVNLFLSEERSFYNLEKLWSDRGRRLVEEKAGETDIE